MRYVITAIYLTICGYVFSQEPSIQQAIANYDYVTALNLIDKEKQDVPLAFMKAQALKGLNKYREAIETYRYIIAERPDNQRAYIEMAESCKPAGRYTEALQCYNKALALNPENRYVQIQRVNLLCIMEKFGEALSLSEEMLSADSSTVNLRLVALCHEGMGNVLRAEKCYEAILAKEPNDYTSVAKLGQLYIKRNSPQEALDVTEKYRDRDTTNLYVNRQNAQALCLMKEYPKAIKRYEYLVNQGDNSHYTCYYLGMSYFAEEKYYEAQEFLDKALRNDPKNVNILYYLGRACARTSWKKEGVAYVEKALNITIPTDTVLHRLYTGLIETARFANMPDKMLESYRELRRIYPKRNHYIYNIAAVYQDYLKDYKNAQRYLEMYLKTKPKDMSDEEGKEEGGTVILDERTYYKAAERRLSDIRQNEFFKTGS